MFDSLMKHLEGRWVLVAIVLGVLTIVGTINLIAIISEKKAQKKKIEGSH
jgi:hypothetical protein